MFFYKICYLQIKIIKIKILILFFEKTARDSCTANIWKNYLVIFGGDRHMMCYKDAFLLNLDEAFSNL